MINNENILAALKELQTLNFDAYAQEKHEKAKTQRNSVPPLSSSRLAHKPRSAKGGGGDEDTSSLESQNKMIKAHLSDFVFRDKFIDSSQEIESSSEILSPKPEEKTDLVLYSPKEHKLLPGEGEDITPPPPSSPRDDDSDNSEEPVMDIEDDIDSLESISSEGEEMTDEDRLRIENTQENTQRNSQLGLLEGVSRPLSACSSDKAVKFADEPQVREFRTESPEPPKYHFNIPDSSNSETYDYIDYKYYSPTSPMHLEPVPFQLPEEQLTPDIDLPAQNPEMTTAESIEKKQLLAKLEQLLSTDEFRQAVKSLTETSDVHQLANLLHSASADNASSSTASSQASKENPTVVIPASKSAGWQHQSAPLLPSLLMGIAQREGAPMAASLTKAASPSPSSALVTQKSLPRIPPKPTPKKSVAASPAPATPIPKIIPKLATDVPKLPLHYVSQLQLMDFNNQYPVMSLNHIKKIRLTIKSNDISSDDWEVSNRGDFLGLYAGRNELMARPVEPNTSKKSASNRLTKTIRRVVDPQIAESRLFDNNIKQMRKNSPHIAQLQHFLKCNYLGFVVLVFNSSMQLLGTYDHRLCQSISGVEVCFQSERKFKRLDFRDKTSANLMSVNFEALPSDAFAIVPVLYDSSPPPAQFPKLDILCNLSLFGFLDEASQVVEEEDETSSLESEETEVITEQASKVDEWFSYGNFAASRVTRESDTCDPNKATMRNQMSYAPFVLFRQEHWHIKQLNETINGVNPRDITLGVLDALKRKYVVPWHVVHVEHCINCEDHSMTTWHIPGSYNHTFMELKKTMRQLLPATLIFHNMRTITPKPRCGSFEIVVHPYQSSLAQCVFSKLSAKTSPNLGKIIQNLSNLILYENVKFSGFHSVEIHVYDNYYRKKIFRASVTLYKVNVNLTIDQDIESSLDAPPPVDEKFLHKEENESDAAPMKTIFQPDKKVKKATPVKKGMPGGKYEMRKKNEKIDSPSHTIFQSTDVKDAEFRHSNAYYRVRNWGKDDITAWFRSYNVSDTVISNALNANVTDGVSLITVGNANTLQQWGVRNRIILQEMLQSLEFLRARDNDKYITDEHIIESSAVMPEASSTSIRLEQVAKKDTNHDGIAVVAVNASGLYMYYVESPLCAPYYSHAFRISSAGSSASCVSLNPKFGKVHFILTLDSENSDITDSDLYSDGGVLISVVHLFSVRRHLVFVKSNTECTKDDAMRVLTGKEPTPAPTKEPDPEVPPPPTSIESPGSDISGTKSTDDTAAPAVINRRDTRYSERPAPLKRATTVGGMLFGEMQARGTRAAFMRSNSKNLSPAITKMKSIAPELREQNHRVLYTTVWLPVGKYYSEVDGCTFEVKQDCHQKIDLSFVTTPSDECAFQDKAEPLILTCHEEQSIKCHRRLVLKSVKAFQKIYRRYKKSFLMDYMFAYMVLRRGFRKIIARIRHTISCRHAAKVQSWVRMIRAKHAYVETQKKILKAQALARAWTARRQRKRMAETRKRIQKNMFRWFIKNKKYKRNCLVMLQCFFRVCKAKKVVKYLRLQKRIDRVVLQWIQKMKYKIELRKYWEYIAYLEACERYYMEVEELHMINFLFDEKAHKRQVAEELARRFEIKRDCMCIVIQKYTRRFIVKTRLARAVKHLRHIQKRFRICRYERKIEEKIPVKYIPSFPHLAKQPSLLGGTKILLGMRLRPKTILEEPHMFFTTDLVMRVLLQPTIKSQATWRMHKERSKYVSRHIDLYGEAPPLFRVLIPKPPTPPDSEDDEMSLNSAKEWDNGAQEILSHLGYSKKLQRTLQSEDENAENPPPDIADNEDTEGVNDDNSTQYNLYNVRSSIRNMFVQPSRRLVMQYDAKYNHCATVIQAAARRYIAKHRVQELRIIRLNTVVYSPPSSPEQLNSIVELGEESELKGHAAKDVEAMSEMSDTIRTKHSRLDIMRMSSSVSETFNSTAKPLVRGLSRALSGSYQAVSEQLASTTEAVKQKYNESKELKKLQSIQEANEKERYERLKREDVCIEDGIMGIRGTVCDGLPRLERQWYIGVFPITFDEAEKGYQMDHQEYEMSQGRFVFEAVRSVSLTPLSRESFNMFRFHVHLADITKYKHIDIALFIEVTENPDNQAVRPDALPKDVSIPSIKQLPPMRSGDVKYLPAFRGTCSVNGGLSFTPCGGRRHVPMTPNLSSAMYLTKAQARRLQTITSLDLVFTLNPVAVQSGSFLQTLYNRKKPYPVYPCGVLDGYLFEKQDIEVKDFYGAVICMVHFHGRNLVSSRHRGLPYGIVEYDDDGKYLGKVVEHSENLGTVSVMIGCHIHVLLCGTSGGVIPLLERPDQTIECTRLVPLHEYPIVGGACIYRADLEFFFTIDRKGFIGIVLLENGLCLKSFINSPLSQDAATTIVASSDKLYIGLSSGYAYTVDVSEILNGNLKEAENLVKYVVSYDMIFKDGAEVASMAIMHPSGYFGSVNEDNKASQLISIPTNITTSSIIKKRLHKINAEKPPEQVYDCCLEGHVVVFGGGDKDPRVRMMRPLSNRTTSYGGFQEINSFTDHTRAITQIALDAAGRFIIAGSQATKKMIIWNAQSFHVEAQHDYANVGFFGIGNNCIFACSFKAPFIAIWKVINWEKIREERRYVKHAPTGSEDGRPHIAMIRKALWCRIIAHGGQKPPEVSLMRASHFLGTKGAELVQRWKVFYDQNIKFENKRISPDVKLRHSPSNIDVAGVMLRKLKSQSTWDVKDGDSDDSSSFMDRMSVVESEDVASKAETIETSAVKMVDAAISIQSGEVGLPSSTTPYTAQDTYDAEWYERNGYIADDGYWYPYEEPTLRERVKYQRKKKRNLPHFSDDSEDETEPLTTMRSSSEEMSEDEDEAVGSDADADNTLFESGEEIQASLSNNDEESERFVFSKERKEMLRVQRYEEKQRLIRRGLLHNLADDLSSSDSD